MKGLIYISLVLASIVVINELAYLGETGLAWVIVALAVAIGLQGYYLLKEIK